MLSSKNAVACSRRPQAAPVSSSPRRGPPSRALTVVAKADGSRERSDGFVTGFVVGGAVFGVLGFLFAPQISKALIGDDQRLRLPKFMEEEAKDPAQTKQELIDKIANLNASIDEVAAKLKVKEPQVATEAASLTNDLKKMLQL